VTFRSLRILHRRAGSRFEKSLEPKFEMGGQHRDTKTQRHRESRQQGLFNGGFLCASVSLCLCVDHPSQLEQLL